MEVRMQEILSVDPRELLKNLKESNKKITMLSVPDFYSARLVDQLGVDCILIGDSLGKTLQGDQDVFSVSIGDILYYTKIVRKAVVKGLIVSDMPYSSYELGQDEAVQNARYLIENGGANAVKLEGGKDYFTIIKALVKAKVPVMGHLGLKDSFYSKQGGIPLLSNEKNSDWEMVIKQAKELEKIGIFALMLECVPAELGRLVSKALKIPVIGQGAGQHVDGQCLIFHDMMGFHEGFKPKFIKPYGRLSEVMGQAVKDFVEDVNGLVFPSEEHEY
tara:strand:+ start:927 stop:1751 length:825 start_codon:yes stop_codon:yes gene_type:complete